MRKERGVDGDDRFVTVKKQTKGERIDGVDYISLVGVIIEEAVNTMYSMT